MRGDSPDTGRIKVGKPASTLTVRQPGTALLRAMIGGACDRDAVSLSDEALLGIARRDLACTMKVSIAPEFVEDGTSPAVSPLDVARGAVRTGRRWCGGGREVAMR